MRWIVDVENSQQIRDVVVFLTQPLSVPGAGLGAFITGAELIFFQNLLRLRLILS